jgi:hypothetical protein
MTLPKQVKPVHKVRNEDRSKSTDGKVTPQMCNYPGVCNIAGRVCFPCANSMQFCFYGRYYCDCPC